MVADLEPKRFSMDLDAIFERHMDVFGRRPDCLPEFVFQAAHPATRPGLVRHARHEVMQLALLGCEVVVIWLSSSLVPLPPFPIAVFGQRLLLGASFACSTDCGAPDFAGPRTPQISL